MQPLVFRSKDGRKPENAERRRIQIGGKRMYIVKFLVRESGAVVERIFHSPYQCRLFVNKLRHSKKLQLISYPML